MQEDFKQSGSGMEIGVYTLGDLGTNPLTGNEITPYERLEQIIQMAKLADELGLDVFGVGEHHRLDYVSSSTAVILSAIARETKRIKLASTTTILSTVDPVRLFEDYATIDLLSSGRAEIIAGRGAFKESFDLFGYDQAQYASVFQEHLDLLVQLNKEKCLTWNGEYRSPIHSMDIAPRPYYDCLPVWVGVGASIESALLAGQAGLGMALAILSGDAERFVPHVRAYRDTFKQYNNEEIELRLAITGHGYIGKTSEEAVNEFYPFYVSYKKKIQKREDKDYHLSKDEFKSLLKENPSILVGSAEDVAAKIIKQYELFKHDRCLIQLDIGGMPSEQIEDSIRLLAEEVMPIVREHTSK